MHEYVRELNHIYLDTPAFWNNDMGWEGFTWCDPNDAERSMLSFLRWDTEGRGYLVICNFCPVLRENVRVGLPMPCRLSPLLNSDETRFGGSGTELKPVRTEHTPANGFEYSVELVSPPMSVSYYRLFRLPTGTGNKNKKERTRKRNEV